MRARIPHRSAQECVEGNLMTRLSIVVPALADLHKRVTDSLKPLEKFRQDMQRLHLNMADVGREIEREQADFVESFSRIQQLIEKTRMPSLEIVTRIAQIERRSRILDEAGWLCHYTMPIDIIDGSPSDTIALGRNVEQYYMDNWSSVRSIIEDRIATYSLDEEAKETFKEAIQAHEAGLFRCVCRVLFPEIERFARQELHGNTLKPITSMKEIRDMAGHLTPAEIHPGGYYGITIYKRLVDHFYAKVTESSIGRLSRDAIPNRHATIHGLVTYKSYQNSMNALFIADFLFNLICVLKQYVSDAERAEE